MSVKRRKYVWGAETNNMIETEEIEELREFIEESKKANDASTQ